jgi:methyl-accepting chemotaxis protein
MIFYFALMGFAIALMAAELYYQVDTSRIEAKLARYVFLTEYHDAHNAASVPESYLYYLRNKVLLLLGVFAFMVAVIMIMFTKTLIGPLQYITRKSGEILGGDLSTTIVMESGDELGKVAECINDLTSNIQEIIAGVDLHRNTIAEAVSEIEEGVRNMQQSGFADEGAQDLIETMQGNLDTIYQSLDELKEMGNLFTLYKINEQSKGDV